MVTAPHIFALDAGWFLVLTNKLGWPAFLAFTYSRIKILSVYAEFFTKMALLWFRTRRETTATATATATATLPRKALQGIQTCLMMRPAQDYFCSWSEHVLPGTSWTMTIRIYLHSSSCPTLLRTYKALQGYSLRDPIRKVSATATATATAKATATATATATLPSKAL